MNFKNFLSIQLKRIQNIGGLLSKFEPSHLKADQRNRGDGKKYIFMCLTCSRACRLHLWALGGLKTLKEHQILIRTDSIRNLKFRNLIKSCNGQKEKGLCFYSFIINLFVLSLFFLIYFLDSKIYLYFHNF